MGEATVESRAEDLVSWSLDLVPDPKNPLDLKVESENLRPFLNGIVLERRLSTHCLTRIAVWKNDEDITELAVVERNGEQELTFRKPTLTEMVNFFRVVRYAEPKSYITRVLEAQVRLRINEQAEAAIDRALALRLLSTTL